MQFPVFLSLLLLTSSPTGHGLALGDPQEGAPKDAVAKAPPIDLALAKTKFDEAKRLAQADHGRLWGKSLDGPKLFVDPRTRFVVGNQADAEGKLKPEAGVFVGSLPPNIPIANTAYQWAGVHWSMLLWPMPDDKTERSIILMHESWHRIQADLGLASNDPLNAHLDTMPGRYWIQLEWRALSRALLSNHAERKTAIEDALLFRQHRRSLFKKSDLIENQLELHEGLAEYTGVKLSALPDAEQRLLLVKRFEKWPTEMKSYVRSFAYFSGPAYGLLLDETAPSWIGKIKAGDDLSLLLATAAKLKLETPSEALLKERARHYDGDKLWTSEGTREGARLKRVAAFRQILVEGPVLVLPLVKSQRSFNPSELVPLEGHGTVYPTLTLSDRWGKLEVRKASLISTDHTKVIVPAPKKVEASVLSGDGWELRLEPGWKLVKGARSGDWKIVEEKSE